MDLHTLRDAKFNQLSDAITDWENMTKRLETLSRDAEHNLKGKADKANWAGYNREVTKQFVDKTAKEFKDAHTQAHTVTGILKDTFGELKGYHGKLHDALDAAAKKHITVRDTGNGTFSVSADTGGHGAQEGSKTPTETDLTTVRDQIQGILNSAGESDTTAAKALKAIVDQAKYGFSDANYSDRDSAANALKAADDMAKLMNKDPHDLTNTELTRLNSYLAKYGKDPLFSEELATSVGPKKVLDFYAGIADPYQGLGIGTDPKARMELAKQLQKNLGITLGTATLSDSPGMEKWEKQMIDLGPKQLDIDDAGNPYGFQAMSALMRFGDYDDDFLNSYGDKLIDYDKQFNNKDLNHWINNFNTADLNFYGKGDRGRDPMTGFLEALGHNPDASTQFFAQPAGKTDFPDSSSDLNDHLRYLTQERYWWSDDPQTDHGYMAGQDALGHALESAATGYSYDNAHPGDGDHRTAATAGVMEQAAYVFGTSENGPKLLHDHPELGDSLGKMGAAYIDDLNHAISGIGGHGQDPDNFQAAYPGRAEFGSEGGKTPADQGAINFLSVLGQNEDSHRTISNAQHIYTLSVMAENPPSDDAHYNRAMDALNMEARVRGIVDGARVAQVEEDFGANSKEANEALGKSAGWVKWGVGAVIGGGVALIPGAEGVGAALIPVAANTAGSAVTQFISDGIDDTAQSMEDDPSEKAQLKSQEFFGKGAGTIGSDYEHYFKGHPERGDMDDVTRELNQTYYGDGPNENEYRGRNPAKKDD